MKGSSKVIMGATMAIVIILGIVLGLVLVLLAELYCSILLRRRKLKAGKPGSIPENPVSQPQQPQDQLVPSPLSSFYAQGVLDAPRSFLFPKLPSKREGRGVDNDDIERPKHGKLHQFLSIQSPQQIGLGSFSSPALSFMPPIKPNQQTAINPEMGVEAPQEGFGTGDESGNSENFMYISNPIYDNEVARRSALATPFETPDSSPSHLDGSGSSGGEDETGNEYREASGTTSLPLSPITELPAKAASVALRDARSLDTSGSESNTQIGRSSSSSDTPRTSPSW